MPVRSCLWFRISTTKSTVSTKIYGKVHSGLVFYTGPGYDSDVMAPATKTTLPQPGLQRRWTALDGEDVSDGGDPYVGYDRFDRTQRSLWLKDTGTELEPVVDVAWGYNALPRQRHRWVGLRRRRPHSAWPERSEGNQAGLRNWRRDTTPGASEEHQDQMGYDQWRCIEERLGTSTDPERQYIWNPRDRWDLILRDRDTTANGSLDEHLWCLKDDLDPVAIADHAGTVVERYDYSAFGMPCVLTPAFEPRSGNQSDFDWKFLFHAEFADDVTGWMNYGYRSYVPLLGRWLARDPIGEWSRSNVYGFVSNSPLGSIDLHGLDQIKGNLYGDWEIDQSEEHGMILPGGMAIAPRSTVTITFRPTLNCDCEEISFIQAIHIMNEDGTTMKVPDFRQDPVTGFAIDRFRGRILPWYGHQNHGTLLPYPIFDEDGEFQEMTTQVTPGTTSPEVSPAILRDRSQNTVGDFIHQFISCIVCKSGEDEGKVYGCLEWGFKAVDWQVEVLQRMHHDKPTHEFETAANLWSAANDRQPVPPWR